MSAIYKYEKEYRSWGIVAGLIFTLGMTALGYYYAAPWYFMAIVGVPTLLLAYNLLVNPLSGIDLNRRYLRVYCGKWEKRVNIDNIEKLNIKRRADSEDLIAICPLKGKIIIIPSECIGNNEAFETTLKNMGIPIEVAEAV